MLLRITRYPSILYFTTPFRSSTSENRRTHYENENQQHDHIQQDNILSQTIQLARSNMLYKAENLLKNRIKIAPNDPDIGKCISLLVNRHLDENKVKEASKFLLDCKKLGGNPLSTTYDRLLSACGTENNINLALEIILNHPDKHKAYPINLYLKNLIKQSPEKATEVFWDLQNSNFQLDLFTYNTILTGLEHKDPNSARIASSLLKSLVNQNFEPDLITYKALLSILTNQGKMGEAEQIVSFMEKKDILPDENCYLYLLRGYLQTNEIQKAYSTLQTLTKLNSTKSEITIVNELLKLCIKDGRIEQAKSILNISSLQFTAQSFVYIFSSFPNNVSAEDVKYFNNILKEKNIPINNYLLTSLISAFLTSNQPNLAFNVVQETLAKDNNIDFICLNPLISYCLKNDKQDYAFKLIDLMIARGNNPTSRTFVIIIKYFCNSNDFSRACEWLQKMKRLHVERDREFYFRLISHCITIDLNYSLVFISEMVNDSIPIDRGLYSFFIKHFSKECGSVQEATKFVLSLPQFSSYKK